MLIPLRLQSRIRRDAPHPRQGPVALRPGAAARERRLDQPESLHLVGEASADGQTDACGTEVKLITERKICLK